MWLFHLHYPTRVHHYGTRPPKRPTGIYKVPSPHYFHQVASPLTGWWPRGLRVQGYLLRLVKPGEVFCVHYRFNCSICIFNKHRYLLNPGPKFYNIIQGHYFFPPSTTSPSLQVFQCVCVRLDHSSASISVTLTVQHGQHSVYYSVSCQFNSHLFCFIYFTLM